MTVAFIGSRRNHKSSLINLRHRSFHNTHTAGGVTPSGSKIQHATFELRRCATESFYSRSNQFPIPGNDPATGNNHRYGYRRRLPRPPRTCTLRSPPARQICRQKQKKYRFRRTPQGGFTSSFGRGRKQRLCGDAAQAIPGSIEV